MSESTILPSSRPHRERKPASSLASALEDSLARIPPLFPLKHFVAVNPFLGLTGRPFREACGLLQRTAGSAPLQQPEAYLEAYREGRITEEDLREAAAHRWSTDDLIATLFKAPAILPARPIPTVADVLDAGLSHARWAGFIREEVSKWCGVHFDENQATWQSPWRDEPLFASWQAAARHDRNPEAFGLAGFRSFVAGLPSDGGKALQACVDLLAPPHIDLADFLHRQLSSIGGWASYLQYLVREDQLRGKSNSTLRDLLAIRLAYDAALFQAFGRDGIFRAEWRSQETPITNDRLLEALEIWQLAYEAGYQRNLLTRLTPAPPTRSAVRPPVQAIFCIDVRSEPLRRNLEAADSGIRTLGFAGFFGFPVAHRGADRSNPSARCPALLVPSLESEDALDDRQNALARNRKAAHGAWKAFQNSAASCFSFVESVGLAFTRLLSSPSRSREPHPSPCLCGPADETVATEAELAAGALRNMSLTSGFARLVLVCGHGSRSANNPYASSLDCGACGGHAGDLNARLAVAALNRPAVRQRLAAEGILIPPDTIFVAGLHDTTTDEVTLYGTDAVPAGHAAELRLLRKALTEAAEATRRERADALDLPAGSGEELVRTLHDRATDISQVRPEWGLAGNAAILAAPRRRSTGRNLGGRVFLHDYEFDQDADLSVLTAILSAPVVVASWINLQYYSSSIDPQRWGAGDKTLHHVVGGIGAMEGNGGDLRVGLPLQSVHDGQRFIHEPCRLTVIIEAPSESIGKVLAAKPEVRELFDNGWIHLVSLQGSTARRYNSGSWREVELSAHSPSLQTTNPS